ncbi:MAG: DUF4920 domain-containing protein [Saprospiraceae bacterium]|nr:DUF4920 domain-containing protein [Saprospiraceae bacterium]
MKPYLFGLFILALASCKNEKAAEAAGETNQSGVLAYYGDSISIEGALTVEETIQSLAANDSIMTSVSGYVTSVCQKKGCWMVLSQNPDDSTGLFVKFRDYEFFVPLDFAGSKVIIKGKAFKEVTTVDELRHYAEDEGKSPEEIAKITEPSEELKFMADGVAHIENPAK